MLHEVSDWHGQLKYWRLGRFLGCCSKCIVNILKLIDNCDHVHVRSGNIKHYYVCIVSLDNAILPRIQRSNIYWH